MSPKPIRILPTAWELARRLLRRTPRLRLLEENGLLEGYGWVLRPIDEEWYDAHDFYGVIGIEDTVRPIHLVLDGGGMGSLYSGSETPPSPS